MSKINYPVTPAIRYLNEKNIIYKCHQYNYEDKGGTSQTATELNVDEHSVIKTIVVDADGQEVIVLMHGDLEVSTKELARIIGAKKAEPATADKATKATGYQFGGTSPFGTKKQIPTYIEQTLLELPTIYINGGKRGFILEMAMEELQKAVSLVPVNVGIKK
ncbi:MAG: Cys-tRNA(Pro) deacylase [Ignavibacteria bacterium]|jgi:Cys-tRNA(Pro) deacylase|nr:Cys-tRNA(Pro) deacylase [Ignavibacteria bacterium]